MVNGVKPGINQIPKGSALLVLELVTKVLQDSFSWSPEKYTCFNTLESFPEIQQHWAQMI